VSGVQSAVAIEALVSAAFILSSKLGDLFGTDARHLALQVALLVALLASLVGVVNAFRMMLLPDPSPVAEAEGMTLG
jgi:uncharacterized membrane protein